MQTNEPRPDDIDPADETSPGSLSAGMDRDASRPGWRLSPSSPVATLDHRFGTDPAVAVAIAELSDTGF